MHADHVSQWSQTALGYFQVTNNLVCIRKNAIHHCLSFSGESAQTGSQNWKRNHTIQLLLPNQPGKHASTDIEVRLKYQ